MDTPSEEALRYLDIVFVVDCTSSMEPYIEEVKMKAISMIKRIEENAIGPQVNFGVVVYGDHPPEDDLLTRSFGPTGDHALIKRNIKDLPLSGGGDLPEAVADGLHAGIEADWREGAAKVMILVGDAPPHGYAKEMPDSESEMEDSFPDGCPCGLNPVEEARRAGKMGITIHAVGVDPGPVVETAFKQIALVTEGSYFTLDNAEKLTELVLEMVQRELDLMKTDIAVFKSVEKSRTNDADQLSASLGISRVEAERAMTRLRTRGVIREEDGPERLGTAVELEGGNASRRFCRYCGSQVLSHAAFCRNCGRRLG